MRCGKQQKTKKKKRCMYNETCCFKNLVLVYTKNRIEQNKNILLKCRKTENNEMKNIKKIKYLIYVLGKRSEKTTKKKSGNFK